MAAQPKTELASRNARLLVAVLKRNEHRLRRQAIRHAQLPEDVDDALQAAYAQFLERFKGDCEPLAWLYTTVKREAWALRRRTSRQREISPNRPAAGGELDICDATPTDAPGPVTRMLRRDHLVERVQALKALKADERRALWLLGLGLSYAEVCEATGWTHTKVNRCASEGRAALRRMGHLGS